MRKIGILTFHGAHNCGSMLQAYAMQILISEQNIECEIIDFQTNAQKKMYSYHLRDMSIKQIVKSILFFKYMNQIKSRYYNFLDFFNNNLRTSIKSYNFNHELNDKDYGCIVAGSDQIWNTGISDFDQSYFLDFAKSAKKISYAPSIGNSTSEDLQRFKHLIDRFDFLSTREERGSKIIEDIVGKEVSTVLDPTLLLEANKWDELINTKYIDKKEKKPYLLFYSLNGKNGNRYAINILKAIAKKYDLDIYSMTPNFPLDEISTKVILDAGPIEFLYYIKNATLVCTNSFHGTAFSLIYEKPFFVIDKNNTNDSRKTNILKQLNLMDRLIENEEDVNENLKLEINYFKVNGILKKLINESNSYLYNALNE